MGDDFEAWLDSQGVTLREIHVLVFKMSRGEIAEAAADAVVEALLKLFQNRRDVFEDPKSLIAYIKTVVKHASGRHREWLGKRPEDAAGDVAWAPVASDPGREMRRREVWDAVRSALDGARYNSIPLFDVVYLIYSESLEQKDVAARYGVSRAAITRAKQKGLALIEELRPELRGEI